MASETVPTHWLGIDVGGSKIYGVLMDADGRVVASTKKRTRPEQGYEAVIERIGAVARRLTADRSLDLADDLRAVGVGLPGPIDEAAGMIHGAVNLGWGLRPIAADLSEELGGIPVVLGNDVNFGALGEATHGAGRGSATAYAVFMGTGLGGALIIGGRVINGAHGLAGEIGHIRCPFSKAACNCGQKGCLETLASKQGMRRYIQKRLAKGKTCLLEDPEHLRASDIEQAWRAGCKVTDKALHKAMKAMGWGLSVIAGSVDPEVVICGGGIFEDMGEALLPLLGRYYDDYRFYSRFGPPPLVKAELGDDAVAVGAAVAGGRMAMGVGS